MAQRWAVHPQFAGRHYLKGRGLDLTDDEAGALHFSPALWHWPSKTRWPAMLARVALADGQTSPRIRRSSSQTAAARRTSKSHVCSPPAARRSAAGYGLGPGPRARIHRRRRHRDVRLSAMRIFGVAAGCAALSEGGVRKLILPPEARLVRVFPDHDELGQSLSAARDATRRWRAKGARSRRRWPNVGEDANDVWLARLRKNSPRSDAQRTGR